MDLERRDNCFDALRLVAAAMVLFCHGWSVWNADPPTLLGGHFSLATLGVSIFFATSGYLVAGSWLSRPNLRVFAIKRSLRILPALIPFLLVAAAVRANYVFDLNPRSEIAPQLWTIPLEIKCYVLVALLGVFGLMRSGVTVIGLWVLVIGLTFSWESSLGTYLVHRPFHHAAQMLVGCFLGGAAVRWLPRRHWLAAVAFVVFILVYPRLPNPDWVWMLTVPYLTIYVAHLVSVRLASDASYGLYIWGFLVQQVLVMVGIRPALMFFVALPVAYGIGRLSWRYVERPALDLKARLVERRGRRGRAYPVAASAATSTSSAS